MNVSFNRTKPVVLLTGVVMVALGIAILVNPIAAVEGLVRIIGWVLVGFAAVTLVPAFMRGNPMEDARGELVLGGIAALSGIVMVATPGSLVRFAWTIMGVIILLTGVFDISEAGAFRRVASPLATPAMVSGVITAVLGAIVILAPMASATLGMLIAAIALLVDGVTEIIFGLGSQ